jgi:hypothetical protein
VLLVSKTITLEALEPFSVSSKLENLRLEVTPLATMGVTVTVRVTVPAKPLLRRITAYAVRLFMPSVIEVLLAVIVKSPVLAWVTVAEMVAE